MEFGLNSLKVFINLVEVQSFTLTARKLGMTQPGVSQHVRALENYFGGDLLSRFGKKFELTPRGGQVYLYARDFFTSHEKFRQSLNVEDPYEGLCRMASPGAFGIGLYSFLLDLNKKYPKLAINFHYAPNKTIERELLSGELDLGFMSIKPKDDLLSSKEVSKERLLVLIPKSKKKSTLNKIEGLEDLMALGFINHPDGQGMLEKVFSKNFPKQFTGFEKIKISGGHNQIGRILEPVALGLGFTVLPHFAYESFPMKDAVSVFKLETEVTNSIYMVSKKYKELPARVKFVGNEVGRLFGRMKQ